jgi:hypothetical protein
MEGLAALSLAANVFQVVDFSTSLLSKSREIYGSGSTKNHADLAVIANDLKTLNERLIAGTNSFSIGAAPSQDALVSQPHAWSQCG